MSIDDRMYIVCDACKEIFLIAKKSGTWYTCMSKQLLTDDNPLLEEISVLNEWIRGHSWCKSKPRLVYESDGELPEDYEFSDEKKTVYHKELSNCKTSKLPNKYDKPIINEVTEKAVETLIESLGIEEE